MYLLFLISTEISIFEDSDDEHECICKSRTISVLYANMRSINPKNPKLKSKIDKLKNLISLYRPQLIVIVETWLTDKHQNIDVLRSLNLEATYEIFRQDRVDGHDPRNAFGHTNDDNKTQGRRGGGVIVLWKKGTYPKTEISFKRSYNEDYADNIVNFDLIRTYCCEKCYGDKKEKKFIFTVVYRRPSPIKKEGMLRETDYIVYCVNISTLDRNEFKKTDQEIMNRLTHLCMTYDDPDPSWDYSGLAMVGDFNFDDAEQGGIESLDSITYGSDCARMPLSSPITHQRGAALDQVYKKLLSDSHACLFLRFLQAHVLWSIRETIVRLLLKSWISSVIMQHCCSVYILAKIKTLEKVKIARLQNAYKDFRKALKLV